MAIKQDEQDDISKVGYSSGSNHYEIKADGSLAIDAPNGPYGELVHIYIPPEDFKTLTKYMEDQIISRTQAGFIPKSLKVENPTQECLDAIAEKKANFDDW